MEKQIIILCDDRHSMSNVEFALSLLSHDYSVFNNVHEVINWLSVSREFNVATKRIIIFDYFSLTALQEDLILLHDFIVHKKFEDKILVCPKGQIIQLDLYQQLPKSVLRAIHIGTETTLVDDISQFLVQAAQEKDAGDDGGSGSCAHHQAELS